MTRRILFIGGPASGKSNYLFRCWIAIEREVGFLTKDALPADLEYLNAGAADLLEGRFAPHTSRDAPVTCRIPVAEQGHPNSKAEIVIPDMSGELWTDLYEKREWPVVWNDLLSHSTGFVLFVRAHSPHEVIPLDWVTCERYYKKQQEPKPQNETPTQVLLVDWLQIVRYQLDRLIGASYVPPVSIVVSAWDCLSGDQARSPQDYLSLHFPLFSDFLISKAHGFEIDLFGASVAAGDFDKHPAFKDSYLAGDPAQQGFAVSRLTRGRLRRQDVLTPLYWALGMKVHGI